MIKITLKNDFHNTEVILAVPHHLPYTLSEWQIRKARRELCGMKDCLCGGPLGERGPQGVEIVESNPGWITLKKKRSEAFPGVEVD